MDPTSPTLVEPTDPILAHLTLLVAACVAVATAFQPYVAWRAVKLATFEKRLQNYEEVETLLRNEYERLSNAAHILQTYEGDFRDKYAVTITRSRFLFGKEVHSHLLHMQGIIDEYAQARRLQIEPPPHPDDGHPVVIHLPDYAAKDASYGFYAGLSALEEKAAPHMFQYSPFWVWIGLEWRGFWQWTKRMAEKDRSWSRTLMSGTAQRWSALEPLMQRGMR